MLNKKIWTIVLFLLLLIVFDYGFFSKNSNNDIEKIDYNLLNIEDTYNIKDYNTFEELKLDYGKIIRDFTEKEKIEGSNSVQGHPMFGFTVSPRLEKVKVSYVASTIYAFRNETGSAITYESEVDMQSSSSSKVSATGNLSEEVKVDGTLSKVIKLKGDLALKIGMEIENKNTTIKNRKEKIKVLIDEGTQVVITREGTGTITNGFAKGYFFWCLWDDGAYEIMTSSEEHLAVEKRKINVSIMDNYKKNDNKSI